MSANRIGVCPKCSVTHLSVGAPVTLEATMREDWEVYVDRGGVLVFIYGCSCSVCEFQRQITTKWDLMVEGTGG